MYTVEIRELVEQLKGLNERELYSGLTILASGYKADWIKNIQCDVVPKVKKSSPTSPYLTEESKRACGDMVAGLTNPDKSIRKKALDELRTGFVKDYYVEPGKLFFEELKNKFRETIYNEDSPERFKEGGLEKPDLAIAIADDILTKNGLADVYIPLIVYHALLFVIKTG